MGFIKDLYYGSIRPAEARFRRGTQYEKILQSLCEKEQKLTQELNKDQLKLLNEMVDKCYGITSITEEETFRMGFVFGVNMMIDVFDENSSTFKQI